MPPRSNTAPACSLPVAIVRWRRTRPTLMVFKESIRKAAASNGNSYRAARNRCAPHGHAEPGGHWDAIDQDSQRHHEHTQAQEFSTRPSVGFVPHTPVGQRRRNAQAIPMVGRYPPPDERNGQGNEKRSQEQRHDKKKRITIHDSCLITTSASPSPPGISRYDSRPIGAALPSGPSAPSGGPRSPGPHPGRQRP